MSYWDWVLPVVGLLLLLFGFMFCIRLDSIQAAKNRAQIMKQLDHLIKQHFAIALIFLMLALPVLLQLIYSVGPCVPVIGASDVLSFWGVVLGLASGFYIWQIQKDKDRQDEMIRCKPVFNASTCRNKNGEMIGICVDSKCLVEFEINKICGLDRKRVVQPFASEVIELTKQDIEDYKNDSSNSKQNRPNKSGSCISFEVVASDGTKWILNYDYSFPDRCLTLCSSLFFSKELV